MLAIIGSTNITMPNVFALMSEDIDQRAIDKIPISIVHNIAVSLIFFTKVIFLVTVIILGSVILLLILIIACKHVPESPRKYFLAVFDPNMWMFFMNPKTHKIHTFIIMTTLTASIIIPLILLTSVINQRMHMDESQKLYDDFYQKFIFINFNAIILMLFVYLVYVCIICLDKFI